MHEVSNICILYINTPLGTRISFRKKRPSKVRLFDLQYCLIWNLNYFHSFSYCPATKFPLGHTRLIHLAKLRNRHIQTLVQFGLPPLYHIWPTRFEVIHTVSRHFILTQRRKPNITGATVLPGWSSSYSVTALFLETLNTAKRYHIRTQMENVHFFYIIIQD